MDLVIYWSQIFEEEPAEDDRPIAISDIATEMQDPITRGDVEIAFMGLKDSFHGLVGIRKSDLKNSSDDLAVSLALPHHS